MTRKSYNNHHPARVFTEVDGTDNIRNNVILQDEERENKLAVIIQYRKYVQHEQRNHTGFHR